MSTFAHPRRVALPYWARHGIWFAAGSAVAFLVPLVGVTILDLQHDVFYLTYFAAVAALLVAYVRSERVDVRTIAAHAWAWSLALGVVAGVAQMWNVLGEAATDRPAGAYFAFELAWRGLGYGVVDALLLSAFPGLIAYGILRGRIGGAVGKLRFTALALPLVLLITATYHLGYPQYREDGVGQPAIGNTIISVPMFATANPIGSVVAHATMHTTAVAHNYETDVFLPPETQAE
jgi:fumarate reductase subunit C